MTAISTARTRDELAGAGFTGEIPVAASTAIVMGALLSTLNGYGRNAAEALGHRVIGVATKSVDNSSGSAGDKTVPYRTGVFAFTNSSGGDAIAQADVGSDCFVVDNDTVAKTSNSGARSVAGTVVGFSGSKVLVMVGIDRQMGKRIQSGKVTLVAGVGTVNSGVWLTAESIVQITMNTPGGTLGTWGYKAADADITVGAPGTGVFIVRSINEDKSAATSDTSVLNYTIIG